MRSASVRRTSRSLGLSRPALKQTKNEKDYNKIGETANTKKPDMVSVVCILKIGTSNWTQDDNEGNELRIVGGHLNCDSRLTVKLVFVRIHRPKQKRTWLEVIIMQ